VRISTITTAPVLNHHDFELTVSGKSTIGNDVAESLSIPFIDGDSLHPQSNIDKMSSGIPLTDDDRLPWLALIRSTAERVCKEEWEKHGGKMKSVDDGGIGRAGVVIACSALKKWYRDILRGDVSAIPPPVDDLVCSFLYHSVGELWKLITATKTSRRNRRNARRTTSYFKPPNPFLLLSRNPRTPRSTYSRSTKSFHGSTNASFAISDP
jgi:carbohydrate kinase (thermoresistant glucokinase family)